MTQPSEETIERVPSYKFGCPIELCEIDLTTSNYVLSSTSIMKISLLSLCCSFLLSLFVGSPLVLI